jgi:RAB protein geranylgeranyltransferase component A
MLSAVEKRHLMKFLQFAHDWGVQESGHTVQTFNEHELAQGRSLNRPQNKTVSSYDLDGFEHRPFREFLTKAKIPSRLQSIIVHGMSLSPTADDLLSIEGLRGLSRHVNALGKFGTTAFLCSLYGVSEIPQAFCRMCAVWGGVYILRRSCVQLALDDQGWVRAVIDTTGRITSCSAFVCAHQYLVDAQLSLSPWELLTRVSICNAPLLASVRRGVMIVPPNTVGNSHAVHVVQLDDSVMVSSPGTVCVYLTTTGSVEQHEGSAVLQAVIELLQQWSGAEEVWHMTTARPLLDPRSPVLERLPPNMGVTGDTRQELHFNDVVKQAEAIFRRVCPGSEFMPTDTVSGNEDEEIEYMTSMLRGLGIKEEAERSETLNEEDTSTGVDQVGAQTETKIEQEIAASTANAEQCELP